MLLNQKMEKEYEKYMEFKRKNETEVSEKHKELAAFIKEVHMQLRDESDKYGAKEAWKRHVIKNEKLNNYAESMYQLATQHWGQSNYSNLLTYCRIAWIKNYCKNYFFCEGMEKYDKKEKYLLNSDAHTTIVNANSIIIETKVQSKINVLDVGSCYNPFNSENKFSVAAIDIAPYSKDVIKCDFLNLKIGNSKIFSKDQKLLIEMPKCSFDTVLFSLFLEYIPCAEQRFLCCKNAYDLLKFGGLLIIVTPDSKHEGSNSKIINTSWKIILGKLGFMRIHYEKLKHIHCLVFRKCFYKEVAIKTINWKKIPENNELFSSMKIFIPQDFQIKIKKDNVDFDSKQYDHNDKELVSFFNELPFENT